VLARAARWRVRHALYFVLLGARAAFDAPVPPAVLARLRPAGPRAALYRAHLRRLRGMVGGAAAALVGGAPPPAVDARREA